MGSVIRRWQRFRGGAGNLAPAIRPHDLPNKTKLHANTAVGLGVGAEHATPSVLAVLRLITNTALVCRRTRGCFVVVRLRPALRCDLGATLNKNYALPDRD